MTYFSERKQKVNIQLIIWFRCKIPLIEGRAVGDVGVSETAGGVSALSTPTGGGLVKAHHVSVSSAAMRQSPSLQFLAPDLVRKMQEIWGTRAGSGHQTDAPPPPPGLSSHGPVVSFWSAGDTDTSYTVCLPPVGRRESEQWRRTVMRRCEVQVSSGGHVTTPPGRGHSQLSWEQSMWSINQLVAQLGLSFKSFTHFL